MIRIRMLTAALLVAGMVGADVAPAFAMAPAVPGVAVAGAVVPAQWGPPPGPPPGPPGPYWGPPRYRRPPPSPPRMWGPPVIRRPVPMGGWNAHVNWCLSRYRSYDPRSNTYQPYSGPRRRCVSPYRW